MTSIAFYQVFNVILGALSRKSPSVVLVSSRSRSLFVKCRRRHGLVNNNNIVSNASHNNCCNYCFTRPFTKTHAMLEESSVKVNFVLGDGTRLSAKGKVGESLYDVKVNNNLDIEGFGACEGNLSCSTCHLILKQQDYDKIGKPDHDEEDVLDTAIGVTKTSRLGCQVFLKKEMDGVEVNVPLERHDSRGD